MKNFKRQAITTDSYFSKIIHYLHANPVHYGFVAGISDWKWPSYNTMLSNSKTKINRVEEAAFSKVPNFGKAVNTTMAREF